MHRHFTLALALLTLASAPGYAQGPTAPPSLPSITLPAELDRVLRDYERAWKAGDEAALAALFTEDGFVPTGQSWVRGRDAIRATYQSSGGGLQLRALAFAVQDTVGYIVGAYGYGDSVPVPDRGKFVLALRRARGGGPWLIAADIDQSNRQQPQ
ncbi:MAG TPA: nuclear transport factor 2 family protein [Gemmatimonadales bacterium]|nr:nuclear transport factor 2 family protein [Gemmatimonadales bacterium]